MVFECINRLQLWSDEEVKPSPFILKFHLWPMLCTLCQDFVNVQWSMTSDKFWTIFTFGILAINLSNHKNNLKYCDYSLFFFNKRFFVLTINEGQIAKYYSASDDHIFQIGIKEFRLLHVLLWLQIWQEPLHWHCLPSCPVYLQK